MSVEQILADKGITLPAAPMPAANYVPFVQTGNLVFISGQISADENGLITGKLGDTTSIDDGVAAARRCGLALIAQLKAAIGDLDNVTRVVKLTGFVNSTPDFTDQPKIINGCSDLMVEVFGDAGRHSRAAVSAPSLPFGVAVEIEAIFEVK
jgi:enamine deaminase RidA (YjgF/YER057c/UK114 family)